MSKAVIKTTKEQEFNLVRKIRAGENETASNEVKNEGKIARKELLELLQPLVVAIIYKFHQTEIKHSEQLIRAGNEGIRKALEFFDPDQEKFKKFKFSTYSAFWIETAIRKSLNLPPDPLSANNTLKLITLKELKKLALEKSKLSKGEEYQILKKLRSDSMDDEDIKKVQMELYESLHDVLKELVFRYHSENKDKFPVLMKKGYTGISQAVDAFDEKRMNEGQRFAIFATIFMEASIRKYLKIPLGDLFKK